MTPKDVIKKIEKAYEEKAEFLDLGRCGLRGVPPEIEMLSPFLKGLNFGGYYLTRTGYVDSKNQEVANNFSDTDNGFAYLKRLPNLKGLYLSGTEIGDRGLESFEELGNITMLDIESNQITAHGAKIVSRLNSLYLLNIEGNPISDVGALSISTLPYLSFLNISNTQLSEKGAEFIARLGNLSWLAISNNRITEIGIDFIATLSKLSYLKVWNANIGDKGTVSLSRLTNLTYLDVCLNDLTEAGARFIAKIAKLIYLDLRANKIRDKGLQFITQLKNLTSLDVNANGITDGSAKYISELNKLSSLDISYNEITDKCAESISKIKSLTSLVISGNRISDVGASFLSSLDNLVTLEIGENKLTNNSSQVISKLSQLHTLDIAANQFSDAGIKALVNNLPLLQEFYANKNQTSSIPEEIINDINALRAFFKSEDQVDNTLVKMILIGNTTAGKSSLARYLSNKKYDTNIKSTHGIQLWKWKAGEKLQVNIWDFGGQDYYHATHNIFLDDKTMYLFLYTPLTVHEETAPKDQFLPAGYWLGNIRSVTAADTPLWYIQSKSDKANPEYLDTALLSQYGVQRQYRISVQQTADKSELDVNAFTYFHDDLVSELLTLAKGKLPVSWVEIRDKKLPEWRKESLCVTVEEFKQHCLDCLQDNENYLDDIKRTWSGLLPYLKGCGEVVYFSTTPGLSDTIFLSAEKLTHGIYNLLSKKVLQNAGEFSSDVLEVEDKKYAELYLKVLLAYELVFEKPGQKGVYIAPQYLPENPHTRYFQQLIKVSYVIRFPHYMSRALITRFLVKYGGSSENNYYWRYGSFFKLYVLNVFVRIEAEQQKIYVHVEDSGGHNRFTVLKELFYFFTIPFDTAKLSTAAEKPDQLEERQEKRSLLIDRIADVPGEIELSIDDINFASVEKLREAITNKAYKIRSNQGGYIEFNAILHQLLNTTSTIPKKIFLSYSHVDEEYKQELDIHFAALKRSGKVETWNSQKVLAGANWDESIKKNLYESDIALLLLSPDFMASDYIWNTEIPEAIKHGVKIIPIFLRPCFFTESVFEVYKNQGLPKRTQWILSSHFPFKDEGYLNVVDGISKLLDA